MIVFIIAIIIGLIIIAIGLKNIKGNIDSIHSYHRHRVSEEDKAIFGKYMGIGTIICGIAVMIFGIFSILSIVLSLSQLMVCGSYLTMILVTIGVVILTFTTIKYNKGLF